MTINDFELFFREINGYQPFPWQKELARQICATGDWPSINLPTSSGKTAVIDIALFHLAVQADLPSAERKAPRRIFFVVDRRLVVDDAARRAERIAERLIKAFANQNDPLYTFARRLEELAGSGIPVEVLRLRGGVPREPNPFKNPLQPMIILSTVDQTGSRLLFRGYGVSEYARPIHAAMVGTDSLIILDEAHLSQPFLQTLVRIDHYRSDAWCQKPLRTPVAVTVMTATPRAGKVSFTLTKEDEKTPLLASRLSAQKPALLVEITTPKDDNKAINEQRASILTEHAERLMKDLLLHLEAYSKRMDQPVVGVVVNRVATARMVFEKLRGSTDAVLLTGRSRPFDRERLIQEFLPRIQAGRNAEDNPAPLFVVATQTVEVGADIDFDALVTEAASFDALLQRFGRLNRFGRLTQSSAVVVYDKTTQKDDPVYGKAIEATWKWLNSVASGPKKGPKSVDFGIRAFPDPQDDALKTLSSPSMDAPVLMPAHVDLLVQTSPSPAIEPDVSALLHGVEKQSADVQIIWRADLPHNLQSLTESDITAIIALVPPRNSETLQLPLWVAKSWLSCRQSVETLSDVETGALGEEFIKGTETSRPVFLWRGVDESCLVEVGELRPGDTIVIPASWGGLDEFGWHPESKNTVLDIADEVFSSVTGSVVVRIHPELVAQWLEPGSSIIGSMQSQLAGCMKSTMVDESFIDAANDFIDNLIVTPDIKDDTKKRLIRINKGCRVSLYPVSDNDIAIGFIAGEKKKASHNFVDEEESSSFTRPITHDDHVNAVAKMASKFAEAAGLPDTLVSDVKLAAWLHDIGKADPRFQALLNGGDRFAAHRSGRILAKSSIQTGRTAYLNARERAGYPKGTRHECYSAAIARGSESLLQQANDKELVVYLIGTHHGRGRPFMPVVNDDGTTIDIILGGHHVRFTGQPGLERLDSCWTDSFWILVRRYGYWGLAFLESLVRLADHRCSEMEVQEND